jgi:transposase InsO family protein
MFPIEKMCKVLNVSRSGYYNWLSRKSSKRCLENRILTEQIKKIHLESKQRYGSPKITQVLNKETKWVSRQRVARMMKSLDLRSKTRRKFKVTTDSKHNLPVCENILNRDFTASGLGEKWVSDITYISTKEGWLYLTAIIDLADRKAIGWSLSDTMTAEATVIPAWNKAIKNRKIKPGLIFHSDRGVQYACNEFKSAIKNDTPIHRSMSRKGNCWDNAVAESFFKILKSEIGYPVKFQTRLEASLVLFEFIEIWYNRKRIHKALGYKTPIEMEHILLNKYKLAA